MKKAKNLYINTLMIVLLGFSLSACDDFLDEIPDNRTQLDTPDKIKKLLIASYPTSNYAVIGEMSADNFFDNRSPNSSGIYYNVNAYDRMDNSLYAWEDVGSVDYEDKDSPFSVWQGSNATIAATNYALEAIETLEAKGNLKVSLNSHRGEALVLRAYAHFVLVNIFANTYKDAETSKNDLGIPYVTKPVNNLNTKFERLSVAKVYELIAEDLEAGIPLIDDQSTYYKREALSYHFSKKAASAFAAKFYLYKKEYEKSLEYANAVLGVEDPSALLRDWKTIYDNSEKQAYAYTDVKSPANLLILSTYSAFNRRFSHNPRYGNIGSARRGSFGDIGPTWDGPVVPHLDGWVWTYDQKFGVVIPKTYEFFEYTDKVARIGYVHAVRTEFTTDATLLDRAEAKIFLNDIDGAVQDLQHWNRSHMATSELTKEVITNFYTPNRTYFVFKFHTQELSPSFIVTAEQKPYVDCVLHFRRIERIFEGDRWFDIKRYGIELEHITGPTSTRHFLSYDSPQRAIQIPADVLGVGVEPNPRPITLMAPTNRVPQLVY